MKRNHDLLAKLISRRESLKLGLIPAGFIAARVISACSNKGDDEVGSPNDSQAGTSAAGAQAGTGTSPPSAGGTGGASSSSTAGSVAQPQGGTGTSPAGSGGSVAPSVDAGGTDPQMMADSGLSTDAGMDTVAGPGVPWATGGTATMTGGYPDPFMGGDAGMACTVFPAQTLGPCYAQNPETRTDISDGLDGLPMRLSLRVVMSDGCTPVPNAGVDIWHSGSQGIYSAYATGTICNPGSDNVINDMFCRGVLVTDADGRVDFDTVFPGWYTGRTIHIHFTIRVGNQEYVTSQIYFEDALTDEILAQGMYAARGTRDTNNSSDGIFSSGGASPEEVLFQTVKRPDGALHAWKLIALS